MLAVLPEIMKKIDTEAIAYGIAAKTLMANAAAAVYDTVKKCARPHCRIAILCGRGNNGGDGYALGVLLKQDSENVCCINVFSQPPKSPEAAEFFRAYTSVGGRLLLWDNEASDFLSQADIIVDALFGTGFVGELAEESPVFGLLQCANANKGAIRIAIDVPSGICAADGRIGTVAFRADYTVTLAEAKPGLFSYPAKALCGEVIIADIGIPKSITERFVHRFLIADDDLVCSALPERAAESHKGDYGQLLAFCGSPNMTGAPYLCAMGALRSGVGLLVLASDGETLNTLKARLSEPVFLPVEPEKDEALELLIEKSKKATAFLIGCGLGKSWRMSGIVHKLILESEAGIILDADGINALPSHINVLKEAKHPPILTPHPLEFSRLCGKSVEEIQGDRINLASAFAIEYGVVLVLKGAATVIAAPDGRVFLNPTGNAALAKGGSGDVLAGVIASLYAQGIPPIEAAVCGVYLHGKAGDILRERVSSYGVLPSDLPEEIAKLLP